MDRLTPASASAPSLADLAASVEAARRAALREDLAARLRTVCADMPEAEFARLVEDMCQRKLQWEATGVQRAAPPP